MSPISPLQHLIGQPGQPLALAERAFQGHLIVHGDAGDAALRDAARSQLGVALPTVPNTAAQSADIRVLWLGPDEWHVQTATARRTPLLEQLRTAFAGRHAAVTDVSDGHTVIVLDHPRATALLSRGCPIDLHLSAFAVGHCVQSLIGKTGVLLLREAPERFAITVRRSFACYLFHVLQDAGAREPS